MGSRKQMLLALWDSSWFVCREPTTPNLERCPQNPHLQHAILLNCIDGGRRRRAAQRAATVRAALMDTTRAVGRRQ